MSNALMEPRSEDYLGLESGASPEDRVRQRVRSVLAATTPIERALERRVNARYPYPYLVQLVPVDANGQVEAGEPVVVVGRHLSERGLTFYHPKPLSFRRVVATLETSNGARLAFVLDLRWCRFTKHGWYESGGRFVDTKV